ncbi:hypothetical protein QBC43DRAFT_357505 [Cladorrhinum sp. PSN259]|nr:hypothetical protein QBC43DRAFT_357505 [Cladorrhinum sp. PSN259]
MASVEHTVHRFWQLPYRWKSSWRENDQIFSQLHLLHPTELNHEVNQKVNADLIFVAGLGGHYLDTWRAVDGTIWPRDLLHSEHEDLKDVRIWSFEYNTTLRGSSHMNQISDHARELLAWMMMKLVGSWIQDSESAEETDTAQMKPIIFVGHSLGGMLIKQVMLIAETEDNFKILWHAVRGAMFFAVPHHGLDRADWRAFATLVLKANPPVLGMRPTAAMVEQAAANGEALLGITSDFRRLQEFLFFVNYSEGRLIPGLSVPLIAEGRGWMDAPRKVELKLDGDHLGICKFQKRDPRENVRGSFDLVVEHLKHLMGASKALEHIGDEAKEALESLCPTGFHGYFMAKQATVGTCRWIAEKKAFRNWAGSDKESRMLWIQGPPASGKSFLTRHIISDLIPPSTTQKVAHCFLDDSVPGRRRLEHLLRATLHHALRVEPELIHNYLVPPYLKAIHGSDSNIPDDNIWTLEVLRPMWPKVVANVTSRGVLTVVVDGFSEMAVECQKGFLDCIDDFKHNEAESEEQRDRLKVLLVSREAAEAQEELEGRGEFEVYKIKPEDVQEDIEKIVMATVANPDNIGQELGRQPLEGLSQDQIHEIRNTVASSSGGNFLVAKMKAQVVSESLLVDTPEETMALVKELPNDIAGMYDETLKRVQQDSAYLPFVKHLLQWAAFQMDPLKEPELNTAVALGVAGDQSPDGQVSREKLESLQKLIGSTRSMVEKHASNLVEMQEGVLQPMDEILKERLTHARNDGWECMEEGPAHAALADTCISYLTMDYFADSHKPMAETLEEKVKRRIEDHAFSRYAALYWKDHVEAAGSAWQGADDHVVRARQLLEDDTTHYGISCAETQWFLTQKTMKGYRPVSPQKAQETPATIPPKDAYQEGIATEGPHCTTLSGRDEDEDTKASAELEQQHEPQSFYNRLQHNPNLVLSPVVAPKSRSPERRRLEVQIAESPAASEIPITITELPPITSQPQAAVPPTRTREIVKTTPDAALSPTRQVVPPAPNVKLDPPIPNYRNRPEEDNITKAVPSLQDGSRSSGKITLVPVPLPVPQPQPPAQNEKLVYPPSSSQASHLPTRRTSTSSRHDNRVTSEYPPSSSRTPHLLQTTTSAGAGTSTTTAANRHEQRLAAAPNMPSTTVPPIFGTARVISRSNTYDPHQHHSTRAAPAPTDTSTARERSASSPHHYRQEEGAPGGALGVAPGRAGVAVPRQSAPIQKSSYYDPHSGGPGIGPGKLSRDHQSVRSAHGHGHDHGQGYGSGQQQQQHLHQQHQYYREAAASKEEEEEGEDDDDDNDSGPEESVMGADGTKKKQKKRHLLKRAFDKTKKIVKKGVGKK